MTEQDIDEFIAPKGVLRNIPKGVKLIYEAHKQALINARIEGAIRQVTRLTILMADGTSPEEYQKALTILHKEKRMLRGEFKKEKNHG